jgi:predicted acetyltransferase
VTPTTSTPATQCLIGEGADASRGGRAGNTNGAAGCNVTVRILSEDQLVEFDTVVTSAFYGDVDQEDQARAVQLLDPDRTHGIFDGTTMVGGGTMLARSMTMPRVGPVPVAAVTWVGIVADQRRRGALTTLMRAQLHGLHENGGEPVAVLWASEGGIYGRFGYGLASWRNTLLVPRGAALRCDVSTGTERVTLTDATTAGPAMRTLHAEYTNTRIGGLSRPEAAWQWQLDDAQRHRGGASALRLAVVPGGYARFRVKENWEPRHGPQHEVLVQELVSLTPTAHAALWQFLTRLDLVGQVRYTNAAADDPLPFMLDNPRHASMQLTDGLFVRLVDIDRALQGRRYAAPLDVVLDISDTFCPWNAGRWRLTVDTIGTAHLHRTNADPDLACSSADLGAAYLGSTKLSTLAAAGRVHEIRPGTLHAATIAFTAQHEPHCLDIF